MTRDEHVAWCKQNALAYVERGELNDALASMLSDLSKHEETRNHAGIKLGTMLALSGLLRTRAEMQRFIEGFN